MTSRRVTIHRFRYLAAAFSTAFVFGAASVGVLYPVTAQGASDSADVSAVEASALARGGGEPVAVTSEFTKTTRVFANPDGTFTAEIAAGPVQVPSEETATGWEDIDLKLADSGGTVEPEAAAAVIEFSDGGDRELASLAAGGRQFGMDWTSTLPAPSLVGDTATYSDVMPGVDLTLQARPEGFEQNLVLSEPPTEPIVLRLPLELKGLSATVDTSGKMEMADAHGNPVIVADPARMWGAAVDPANDEPTVRAYVDTRVVNTPTGPKLEIAPDPEFFETPGLTYPVTVDPAPDLAVDKDTYVDSSLPSQVFRNDTFLKVGSPDGSGRTRSYLKFQVGAIAGKLINSATLTLYSAFSASCPNDTTVHVFEAKSPGIQTNTTWNNQPGQGDRYASTAFSGPCGGSAGLSVNFTTGGYNNWTMTDLVRKWASNTSTNYGVRLEAQNETVSNGYKKFKSTESAGNRPVLTVNYNSYPNTPTALSASKDAYGMPTLHATFSDPDGGSGQVAYTIYNAQGNAVLTDAMGAIVVSGSDSYLAVPYGTLVDGQSYTWKARATDTMNFSIGYSATQALAMATTPNSPSLGLPEGGAYTSGATDATFSSSPTFTSNYDDPNLGRGSVEFNVMNATCKTTIASGVGGQVSDGQASTWSITPGTTLSVGSSYGLVTTGIDVTGTRSLSSVCSVFSIVYPMWIESPAAEATTASLTPTAVATVGSAPPAPTAVTFTVLDAAGAVVTSGQGSVAAPGGTSSWTVPQGVLQAGSAYSLRAEAAGGMPATSPFFAGKPGFGQVQVTGLVEGQALWGSPNIQASATGFDQIDSVEFLVDGSVVTVDATAPFEALGLPIPAGSHVVSARANGSSGGGALSVTSPGLNVTEDPEMAF